MPDYNFTSPEGKSYSISGPEGSTREEAFTLLPQKYPELAGTPGFEGVKPAATAAPVPAAQPKPAQTLQQQRLQKINTASANGMLMPLQPGYSERLAELPYKFGAGLTDIATRAGFGPEVAAAIGTYGNVVSSVFPMGEAGKAVSAAASGTVAGAKKLKSMYQGKEIEKTAAEVSKGIAASSSSAQKAHEMAALKELQVARRNEQAAQSAAAQRGKLEEKLAQQTKSPSLHHIGETLRGGIETTMAHASEFRAQEGDKLFKAAKDAAAVKAAAGKFVDTTEALKPIQELFSHVQGIPGLEDKVGGMAQMLHAAKPDVKKAVLLLDKHGEPLVMDAEGKTPMTFEHAEVIRRYLNDIAYQSDLEGYPGIARRAAREAVKGLDKAMGEYVPEFNQYKEGWATLSKPLESMGTKLGRAVFGAEGGIKSDAYVKVASEDLPGKFFGSKEGVDTLVDALAGGKNAPIEAWDKADKLAQRMALQYFEEKSRQMGAEAMQKFVQSPAQRGVLEAMPKVSGALERQAALGVQRVGKVASLKEAEAAATKRAEVAAAKARDFRKTVGSLRESVFKADAMGEQKSAAFQAKAVTAYKTALDGARKAGAVSDTDYKAMMGMLDRVQGEREKLLLLKRIVHSALWISGAGFAGTKVAESVGGAAMGVRH